MHELAVCQALIRQVETLAVEHRARRVEQVVVRIGPLAGVEADLLQRAYPLARAGTVAASAELVIETMPIKIHCNTCGGDSEAQANRLICAACGDWRTRLISGDEMLLASIAMTTDSTPH